MNRFASPPPLDELGEVSWHRLERSLFEALDAQLPVGAVSKPSGASKRLAKLALLGGALAAAAGIVLFIALRQPAERAVTTTQISRLVTGDTGSSMTVGDAAIRAASDTAIIVHDGANHGITVTLERGTIDCAVAKRDRGAPFRVVAGEAIVEVIGTRFAVERVGDSARVTVESGTVTVLARGELSRVSAGSTWPRQSTKAIEATPGETEATDATEPKDAAPTKAPTREPRVVPEETKDATSAKQRYLEAAQLESSDPAAALVIYKRLADVGGSWAATALFAAGRLEFERGRDAAATRLLERYLRAHPRGINAADARSLLDQLRKRQKRETP